MQKRAIRIIRKESRLSHTDPIFKELNLLKINDIYRLQLLKCYFKYEHNLLPKYLNVFNLRLNSEIHAHNTRNQHKLRIPFVKHNFAKACVRYQLTKTVNSMPRSITDKVHTHSFNLFTTIHDWNFRRHSSMNVTIKWHKFSSNIYYIYVFFVIWSWKLR